MRSSFSFFESGGRCLLSGLCVTPNINPEAFVITMNCISGHAHTDPRLGSGFFGGDGLPQGLGEVREFLTPIRLMRTRGSTELTDIPPYLL